MHLAATSTAYVKVQVTPPTGVDITSAPVKLAILPASNRGNPAAGDWKTAAWVDGSTARLLVGPDGGALTLAHGDYRVWITFDPPGGENIVELSGHLGIT
ncbi:hypothetical protein [Streptomyces sp. MZ04]|uniref:hypothetical protein n=1 Tax=Streptomyces sp. MZ04 TaxID=2559236 RepID=UPI00107E8E05|nr:hypothetical protein [Streptomyces sp. MZ04]TGB13867.1 hypothetical protein E2651_07975 [Streptomyces sp. MZ04]